VKETTLPEELRVAQDELVSSAELIDADETEVEIATMNALVGNIFPMTLAKS